MTNNNKSILFLGAGYTAKEMMRQLQHTPDFKDLVIYGTTRSGRNFENIKKAGGTPILYEGTGPSDALGPVLRSAPYILVSISPKEQGDLILQHHLQEIKANQNLSWVGYLSTVGVYGNHDGAWVSEDSQANPSSKRSQWRKLAEDQWLDLHQQNGIPAHIFRLPGIYGPGRGPTNKLKKGTARRIEKKGQVFNRAHVEDIANILIASMSQPNPGAIYNVSDDEPAPPQDVLAYAAQCLGLDVPPLIPFEQAEMTQMAKSFYTDNKRISNKRIKEELGVSLKYPTYREGIKACL